MAAGILVETSENFITPRVEPKQCTNAVVDDLLLVFLIKGVPVDALGQVISGYLNVGVHRFVHVTVAQHKVASALEIAELGGLSINGAQDPLPAL